jgi:hypothetical protein
MGQQAGGFDTDGETPRVQQQNIYCVTVTKVLKNGLKFYNM